MNPEQDTHSTPIPIDTSGHHRRRSSSVSSDSSNSPETPVSSNPPKVTNVSPSTSPMLSYFMSQSPTAKTFPFRRGTVSSFGGRGPVFEEAEDASEPEYQANNLHRRASSAWAGSGSDRYPQPPAPIPDNRQERATGFLRRLSLSTPFGRPPIVTTGFAPGESPSAPPNTAYPQSPTTTGAQSNRNLSPGKKPKRAPSPMGERILKGHFDGFN